MSIKSGAFSLLLSALHLYFYKYKHVCVCVYIHTLTFSLCNARKTHFWNSYIPKEHQTYFNKPFVPCFPAASSFCSKYLTFAVIYLEELRFLNNKDSLKMDYLNWSLQNQTFPDCIAPKNVKTYFCLANMHTYVKYLSSQRFFGSLSSDEQVCQQCHKLCPVSSQQTKPLLAVCAPRHLPFCNFKCSWERLGKGG